jgi:hypothetical protein
MTNNDNNDDVYYCRLLNNEGFMDPESLSSRYDTRVIRTLQFEDDEESYDWNVLRILPSPSRLVMFHSKTCNLCGKVNNDMEHFQYYTSSIYDHEGYNVCNNCKVPLYDVLKTHCACIWNLITCDKKNEIWVHRTRRDPITNQPIQTGKYSYERWSVVSNYTHYVYKNGTKTAYILCETINKSISKLVAVNDILLCNYNAWNQYGVYNETYNPNEEDPMNTLILNVNACIIPNRTYFCNSNI